MNDNGMPQITAYGDGASASDYILIQQCLAALTRHARADDLDQVMATIQTLSDITLVLTNPQIESLQEAMQAAIKAGGMDDIELDFY